MSIQNDVYYLVSIYSLLLLILHLRMKIDNVKRAVKEIFFFFFFK